MEDTQYPLSTKGRKGDMKYHNPIFNQPGYRGVDSSRHITILYTTNLLEVLPPIYIFYLRAKNSVNFKIEPSWVEWLPTITGKFGRDKKFLYHSSVAVWKKGSMYESLFWIYVEKIVLKTYPNASITIE